MQEISGGSAGDSKIEGHEGRCLGLKGINSLPAKNKRNGKCHATLQSFFYEYES